MHEAGSVTIKGKSYPISVDDDGSWHAWPGGEQVSAPSRAELVKAITRHTRKATAKIAVPFTLLDPDRPRPRVRDGVATGLHSSSRNILVRWPNGDTEQLTTWNHRRDLVQPLTEQERAEWSAKVEQHLELTRWLNGFREAHEIDLAKAVREALDQAVAGDPE